MIFAPLVWFGYSAVRFVPAALERPDWRLAFMDQTAMLFLREIPENEAALAKAPDIRPDRR